LRLGYSQDRGGMIFQFKDAPHPPGDFGCTGPRCGEGGVVGGGAP